MHVIHADNVNAALERAVLLIRQHPQRFIRCAPRSGRVTQEFNCPVTTVYSRPWRRVLFNSIRDANPFFHLMESLWMLAGRNDAEWISQFSSKISQYAEDDGTFHGAYGWRWRNHFDDPYALGVVAMDQLIDVVNLLRKEPQTRRAVLAMWDPSCDLGADKRDLPCNTHIYFKKREGLLNMTVCCRSNDITLGLYGANAVHFSVLHELIAAAIDSRIGVYEHVSDSWHYYEDDPYISAMRATPHVPTGYDDYYEVGGGANGRVSVSSFIVSTDYEKWLSNLTRFVDNEDWNDITQYDNDLFFSHVAVPMRDAWTCYKRGDFATALVRIGDIKAPDWRVACFEWLGRRASRRLNNG